MKRNMRIMFVDENASYRDVLKVAIDCTDGIEVISQCGTAETALRNLQQPGLQSHPDIILMDLHLPGMSGFEAMPWIRKYSPDTKMIVLTRSNNPAYAKEAVIRGASGYLLKSATHKQIIQSIQEVVKGGFSVDPQVGKYIIEAIQRKKPRAELSRPLSEREAEVLGLLADGLVKKEIAGRLMIGTYTVQTHVKNILDKLDAANAAAAVNKAFRLGLFSF